MKVDENTVIDGNVNVLVQVVNNIISNAIQAYDGKHDQNIQFEISQKENNMIFLLQILQEDFQKRFKIDYLKKWLQQKERMELD